MRPDSLYDLPVISDPRLSPDGGLVAFTVTHADVERNANRSAIWLLAGDRPRRFTAGVGRDSAPRFSPTGDRLLFLSARDDGPAQLYVIAVDGGEAIRLTDLREGAASPCWSPDGSRIAFTSIVPDPEYAEPDPRRRPPHRIRRFGWRTEGVGWTVDRFRHVFVLEAHQGAEPIQLTDGSHQDADPAWSPDGSQIAFVSSREPDGDRNWWAYDLHLVPAAGGEAVRLTDGGRHYAAPAWSPDGRRIACRHLVDIESWPRNGQIAVVDAVTGAARTLTEALDVNCSPMSEPREPIWDDDRIVFPIERRGTTQLYAAAADGSVPPEVLIGGDGVVSGHDLRGGRLVHAWHTAAEPAELFEGSRRLTRLTEDFRRSTPLSPAERFAATSPDGAKVEAWLIRPTDFEPGATYPVLLFIHGGPFFQYRNGFFDEFQVAARAGYAVVYANPRGSSGYGEAWARTLAGPFASLDPDDRPDFRDLMTVMDEVLARFDFCDRTRTGVIGGSYGGFMTAWIVGHSDRFKAACAERGVYNQLSQLGTTDMAGPLLDAWDGRPYEDLEAAMAHSPISYATRMRTPLLLIHGEDDLRVSIGQAEELFTALRTLERDIELVRFPAGDHGLSRDGSPRHRVLRFEIILDWFDRHLGRGDG